MSKFNAKDMRTWSPLLVAAVEAVDALAEADWHEPDEVSYLFGYVGGCVIEAADAAGIDVDLGQLVEHLLDEAANDTVPDPGLMIEDAAETASDGGEL